jgi:hypothetical protein
MGVRWEWVEVRLVDFIWALGGGFVVEFSRSDKLVSWKVQYAAGRRVVKQWFGSGCKAGAGGL